VALLTGSLTLVGATLAVVLTISHNPGNRSNLQTEALATRHHQYLHVPRANTRASGLNGSRAQVLRTGSINKQGGANIHEPPVQLGLGSLVHMAGTLG